MQCSGEIALLSKSFTLHLQKPHSHVAPCLDIWPCEAIVAGVPRDVKYAPNVKTLGSQCLDICLDIERC